MSPDARGRGQALTRVPIPILSEHARAPSRAASQWSARPVTTRIPPRFVQAAPPTRAPSARPARPLSSRRTSPGLAGSSTLGCFPRSSARVFAPRGASLKDAPGADLLADVSGHFHGINVGSGPAEAPGAGGAVRAVGIVAEHPPEKPDPSRSHLPRAHCSPSSSPRRNFYQFSSLPT